MIDESGDVWFKASINGGTASSGLFRASGSTITPFVLAGDPAPGTGGGSFGVLHNVVVNSSGDLAFRATITGADAGSGIFLYDDGLLHAGVLAGDAAPGSGGGTYSWLWDPVIKGAGELAFLAGIDGGNQPHGLFVTLNRAPYPIALVGDTAPMPSGESFVFLGSRPSIDDSGWVAFWAGAGGKEGIFVPEADMPASIATGVSLLVGLARRRRSRARSA